MELQQQLITELDEDDRIRHPRVGDEVRAFILCSTNCKVNAVWGDGCIELEPCRSIHSGIWDKEKNYWVGL